MRRIYPVAGIALGCAWAVGGDKPVWEHAIRTVVLLLVLLPVAEMVLNRRRARGDAPIPRLRHGPIITAKLSLVVLAAGAQLALALVTSWASVIVGIALAAVIIGVGPFADSFFVRDPKAPPHDDGSEPS
ncbi:hypothetical protein EDD29_0445 [Actinocorallia herbida]|uniref:Uncharacterized protein n=1 Tax=Actinocorallia herbida TaxID=58109 RepID=A0A3N1CNP9_9ACTN|nr:hypothetical protein [Actinocorallia herbida]ROO82957.1 hypothetical protein EDD29_0445 [Actinocorallia herbida]